MAKTGAVDLLATELKLSKCHIALITESWFTSKHSESVVSICNYQLLRRDRGSRGGGVCAYIRGDVTCVRVDLNTINDKVEIVVKMFIS